MYVTTFYSFKGGVGRTLALANVGLELARIGRRVLLVDFDLEAPGLDTIGPLAPKTSGRGMVDFVTEYVATRQVPRVRDYLYEAPLAGKVSGRVWVMPAGKQDGRYAHRLAAIDWQDLYQHMDGYLLMEDLRQQWERELQPDYVLIDSRTGHTEVGGICTRQLPDAVVLLFLPNQQNLEGLASTVRSIRAEAEQIDLLFVMSNVPDLDDEEEILQKLTREFAAQLRYRRLSAVIHRYDSLTLLNQSLFVLDRPKSRLAKEYCVLASQILSLNPTDRDGALRYLESELREMRKGRGVRGSAASKDRGDRIKQLQQTFSQDSAVLWQISHVLQRTGRRAEAMVTLEQAIDVERKQLRRVGPALLIEHAQAAAIAGQLDRAIADIEEALQEGPCEFTEVLRAVSLFCTLAPERLTSIAKSPVVADLNAIDRLLLTHEMTTSRPAQAVAVELLSAVSQGKQLTVEEADAVRDQLSLCLIGSGRFEEAARAYAQIAINDLTAQQAFNLAMAQWGIEGCPPLPVLQRVCDFDAHAGTEWSRDDANYLQCLALTYHLLAQPMAAAQRLEKCRQLVDEKRNADFSCWSYLRVGPDRFHADLDEMTQYFCTGKPLPRFLPRQAATSASDTQGS